MQSPGGPYAVRTTNFVPVASLQLTKANLKKTNFSLEKVRSTVPQPRFIEFVKYTLSLEYLTSHMRQTKLL